MIKVYIHKSTNNTIEYVSINGHANYDEAGKDIVCSAVSALTIGAVNSVEKLLGIDLNPKQSEDKDGYLAWNVPKLNEQQKNEQLQLLMNAMVESLLMIEENYNSYLNVIVDAS